MNKGITNKKSSGLSDSHFLTSIRNSYLYRGLTLPSIFSRILYSSVRTSRCLNKYLMTRAMSHAEIKKTSSLVKDTNNHLRIWKKEPNQATKPSEKDQNRNKKILHFLWMDLDRIWTLEWSLGWSPITQRIPGCILMELESKVIIQALRSSVLMESLTLSLHPQ